MTYTTQTHEQLLAGSEGERLYALADIARREHRHADYAALIAQLDAYNRRTAPKAEA